jgi:hypothetical protein
MNNVNKDKLPPTTGCCCRISSPRKPQKGLKSSGGTGSQIFIPITSKNTSSGDKLIELQS